MDTVFVPASQDVAIFELRVLHENSQVRRTDYQQILQALIPGGTLLATALGRRIAAVKRVEGLNALARIAHQLHEASRLALFCAITELAESEATPR